ncbi:Aminoglycoside phosphotransferase [Penicillium alfredii]|uniref:Aminoglycoside phosphotransferase n=1 Tax=Penicillium alfredii TaxID=1506179 RepID=A0A9W9K7I2_9EURO|nr:Aminoglycoside phosphotransferase [Penicillium alfredii]KAJ5095356.1 Aminoglycoside phosphotransferase [Penicillium alfredii]
MQHFDRKAWPAIPSLGGTDNPMGSSHRGSSSELDESQRLKVVLSLLFPPTVRIQHTRRLPSHIHPLRLLRLSNGACLLLKSSPSSHTALLRWERSFLETEARFLALLGHSANPCIPQLYHYDPHGGILGSAYLLRQYVTGVSLLEMETRLSVEQRKGIDRHLGFLVRAIGQHVSRGFGSLQQVARGAGKRSWREAFCILFEGVLRDAEDMFIHLPYSEIRHELARLAPALEEVTLPRLVVVDFGRPAHVLLDEESKQLSGVVDFSSAFWGDLLMAEILERPSHAALEGAGMSLSKTTKEGARVLLYVVRLSCFLERINPVCLDIPATDWFPKSPFNIIAAMKRANSMRGGA